MADIIHVWLKDNGDSEYDEHFYFDKSVFTDECIKKLKAIERYHDVWVEIGAMGDDDLTDNARAIHDKYKWLEDFDVYGSTYTSLHAYLSSFNQISMDEVEVVG